MDVLPWSTTRVRTFQECRRKYYYRYHLAPLARRPGASGEAQRAGRVKDLVGLDAWAGELVHRVIQDTLNRWRAGREFSEEEAVAHAVRLLSRQFRDSQAYWGAHPDEFARRPVLLDLHYYERNPLGRETATGLKERVACSIREFLHSDLAARIREAGPSCWLPVDRNAAAHLEDGLLILVKPDFAFRDGPLLRIVDWKTSRPDPFWEVVQVTCYALYAAEKWGHPLDRIVPQIVHLYPSFRISDTDYSDGSLRDVQLFIRETQAEIAALVDSSEMPDMERFSLAGDCQSCRWCQFREICEGAQRSVER
jgi:PD-(D/E)XK nuclease superfamily protein